MPSEKEHTPEFEQKDERTVLVGTYSPEQLDSTSPLVNHLDNTYGENGWKAEMRTEDQAEHTVRVEMGKIARTAARLEWAGFGHTDHEGNEIPKNLSDQPLFQPMYDVFVMPEAAERAKKNEE